MINSVMMELLVNLEKEFSSYRSAERKIKISANKQDELAEQWWTKRQVEALNRFYWAFDKLMDEFGVEEK